MNKYDLPNISILAIEGYGEQEVLPSNNNDDDNDFNGNTVTKTNRQDYNIDVDVSGGVLYRGKRAWRDTVGGATICCNQCCSILGYASIEEPETCRLLKHRLCAKKVSLPSPSSLSSSCKGDLDEGNDVLDTGKMRDCFATNSCMTFVARELVRYAENQAVFTFMIFSSDSRKVLMIKLLSWNTLIGYHQQCHNERSRVWGNKKDGNLERVAKVIFEEIDNVGDDDKLFDETDPMNFSWGGFDLCCPPFSFNGLKQSHDDVNTNHKRTTTVTEKKEEKESNDIQQSSLPSIASVHLHLPLSEYEEIKKNLVRRSKLFPKAIARPTILLKLGVDGESKHGNAGLSFLELPV